MAQLIYSAIASLDGYIEDAHGSFDWAAPDDAVHSFINDLERSTGTYLLGRKTYETMQVWETDPSLAEGSPITRDFAGIWNAAEKIVYSTSLAAAPTRNTRIERDFDPEAVRRLKASARHDLGIGGPDLAARAFQAGLVDTINLFVAPVIAGGGKKALPETAFYQLALVENRRFESGFVFLQYHIR